MPKRKTQQDFLDKANRVHKSKYDYSKAIYKAYDSMLIIICSIHGEFEQMAYRHLYGNGCRECGKDKVSEARSKSQETFIAEAVVVHKGKYDYSKIIYTNAKNKVIIICPEHGEFPQADGDHLSGHGCFRCGIEHPALLRVMSFEVFVEKANKIHEGKYSYYPECHSSGIITIYCPIHGDFPQDRGVHLQGHGCQACVNRKPLTVPDVIMRSKTTHGNLYDYTSLTEIGENYVIQIICPKHGVFPQNAHDHMSGHGCYQCGVEQNANRKRKAVDKFIEQANEVHKGIYDYSQVEYVNNSTKVIIICKKHDPFPQEPQNHLQKHGCPSCSHHISKPEIRWLSSLGITDRQRTIKINGKKYKVDGFDSTTNTIYEFYGDFWHGNPKKFDHNKENHVNYKTFGELYDRTLKKEVALKQAGYNVVSIWESDFIDQESQANKAA